MTTAVLQPRRRDALMSLLYVGALIIGFVGTLLSVRLLRPEHVFVFNPSIDTMYAPGYAESRFDTIRKGMSTADVHAVLGEPLHKQEGPNGTEYWHYTNYGACRWWDFAWYVREVQFGYSGHVTNVVKDVRYD